MQELRRVLLKHSHRVQRKLIVRADEIGGARHDHRTKGFVRAIEVFDVALGDGDEVRFEMFGVLVLDEDGRVDDGDEGFSGEVACLFAVEGGQVGAQVAVLVVFSADVVVD